MEEDKRYVGGECEEREEEREISARCLATDEAAQSFVKSYSLKPCSAYLVDIFLAFSFFFSWRQESWYCSLSRQEARVLEGVWSVPSIIRCLFFPWITQHMRHVMNSQVASVP